MLRALWVVVVCSACSAEGPSLVVDLRTDYVPDDEFVSARVLLRSGGAVRGDARESVGRADDFSRGRRIAEFGGLTAGAYELEVTLLDAADSPVASRLHALDVSANRGVTVIITRDCAADSCSGGLTCHGGRCVEPACSSDVPGACGVVECSTATDCTGGADCTSAECVLGACLAIANHDLCSAGFRCHPETGCGEIPDAGTRDAGSGDAAIPPPDTGSSCVAEICNGRDDDCDRSVDEGFECQAGGEMACTTECGVTGRRSCNMECRYDPCAAPDEVCDNGCDDDRDDEIDEGCGALHDTCAEAIDVSAGGTFHASTCGAEDELRLDCGELGTPEVIIQIAPPGGTYVITTPPGFVAQHVPVSCSVAPGTCAPWESPWGVGTGGFWLAVERADGDCGAFTITVRRE